MEIKAKINKQDVLKSKGFTQQREPQKNKKRAHKLRENICKWCEIQGISLQNLQVAQDA